MHKFNDFFLYGPTTAFQFPTHKFVGINAAVGPYQNKLLNLWDNP